MDNIHWKKGSAVLVVPRQWTKIQPHSEFNSLKIKELKFQTETHCRQWTLSYHDNAVNLFNIHSILANQDLVTK